MAITKQTLIGRPSTSTTIGVPVEVNAFLTPRPYFGIGIKAIGNINNIDTGVGVLLAIQVGQLT